MSEHSAARDGAATHAHRVLDRLTALKLRVGALRLRLRLGLIAPREMEPHLATIEQEIDATAVLALDMQTQGSSPG